MVSYLNPSAPSIPNPVGIDSELQKLQERLVQKLSWLQVAYGRATRNTNGAPEVYAADGEYRDVLPNDNVTAQSFFVLRDPATNPERELDRTTLSLSQSVDLVVWVDLKQVDSEKTYRFDMELQRDVLKVLVAAGMLPTRVYSSPEEVYQGFKLDPQKDQFLRHPYAGFRITMDIFLQNVLC